ncbi:MAG: hypothetical protein NZ992_00270 [Candidatus Korarchaeum sp.]|nr:hypothetical protein [Candidatus Korarchaeum sp.]MDW8035247.1 hypothetical protein [Candidatus Korarchaeum sp.]
MTSGFLSQSGPVFPDSLVLSLAKVVIDPEFREEVTGEPDPLLLKVVGICSRKLSVVRHDLLLGDLCNRFASCRMRRGLSNLEVKEIKGAAEGLSMLSPPYLIIESYPFGLTSYRVSSNFKLLFKDQDKLLESWRRVSRVFRSILDSRIPIVPRSLTSKFFSEIYAFYEYDLNFIYLRRFWPTLEQSLVPERSEIASFLSPLKTMSEAKPFELGWIPDPSYASSDGILVRFFHSGAMRGKRRYVHATRRKKRRVCRVAIDQVLGLKVFLENQDLWTKDPETLWGALTGMIYLNPDVLTEIWRLTGRRFLYVYKHLFKQFDLRERFENYEKSFWFPFRNDLEIASFLNAVRVLGGSPPEVSGPYSLDNLQLDALKLIVVKSQLDSLLMPWDEVKLLYLCRYLCGFLRSHQEAIVEISRATGGCAEELLSQIRARRKRKGLTYLELSSILVPLYGDRARNALMKSSSLLARLSEMGLIEGKVDLRGRVKRKGDRTVKGFKVTFYVPSRSKLVEILWERLMDLSQEAAENIMGEVRRVHQFRPLK